MGTPKALLEFEGEALIVRLVRALREGGAGDVLVVVGPGEVGERISNICGASTTINAEPERGMLSSVQTALEVLPEDVALLVCPCDLPLLQAHHVWAVLAGWNGDSLAIVRPLRDGRGGHPALFGPGLRAEILALDSRAVGLSALQKKRGSTDIQIDEDGPFRDADTPEDWAQLTNGRTRRPT
jgi:CTP:molybdopterin cytidylyltransferase MocA